MFRQWPLALVFAFAVSTTSLAADGDARGRMSLDVTRADIHSVLRLLAERGPVNLLVDDSVSGVVTLRLRNVRWQDALTAVLSTRGLGSERQGNIIWVAPLKTLAEQAAQRARLAAQTHRAGTLVTHVIRVNDARAEDLAAQVRAMLSDRGSVSVDARTNSLIIRDVE